MPLHYLLFRMCAAHLPHEANSESTFFRAGMLSDPNLEPGMHAVLMRINGNKATYKPLSEDLLARYKRNYHLEYMVEAEAFFQASLICAQMCCQASSCLIFDPYLKSKTLCPVVYPVTRNQ